MNDEIHILSADHYSITMHVFDQSERRGTQCRVCDALTRLAALRPEQRYREVVEALRRYGRHTSQCRVHLTNGDEPDCTCGLHEVVDRTLAALRPEPVR